MKGIKAVLAVLALVLGTAWATTVVVNAATTTVRASCTPSPVVSDAGTTLDITTKCKVPKPPPTTVTATVTQTATVTAAPSPTDTTTPTPSPTSTAPAGTWCDASNAYVQDYLNPPRYYDWTDTAQSVKDGQGWGAGGMDYLYADQDMWNVINYAGVGVGVTQHGIWCADKASFTVEVTADNAAGDGAVKTYPNLHEDTAYIPAGEKAWSTYKQIDSTFEHSSPGKVGIYDVSYDVWFNNNAIELMVWTENYRQTPSGSKVGQITFAGTTWDVWATNNKGYIALVPVNGGIVTSGNWNLINLFNGLNSMGLLPTSAVMGQLDYGVEVVSTGGTPQTWQFRNITYTVN